MGLVVAGVVVVVVVVVVTGGLVVPEDSTKIKVAIRTTCNKDITVIASIKSDI